MKTKTDLQILPEVILWKEKGIVECICEFSCGGDQMNDIEFKFYTKKGEIKVPELEDYFDENVYKNVEFYVNSDGHYMGEAGQVVITLDDDEESFNYSKEAQSEWSETFSDVGTFKLTKEYKKFLTDKIHSIVGGADDSPAVNYKADCILTDDEEEILKSLLSEIDTFACDFEISGTEGEASDWYNFSTNVDRNTDIEDVEDTTLVIEDDTLLIRIQRQYYVYRPSED